MTNTVTFINYYGFKLIYRHPGKNSNYLVNRNNEREVYDTIAPHKFCCSPLMLDLDTGEMINKYIEGEVCNPDSWEEIEKCMETLKRLHNLKLQVKFEFDVFTEIEKYEVLVKSKRENYWEVRNKVFTLRDKVKPKEKVLCHIDPVPDNFIITPSGEAKLIDWEYSAMCNSDIDIAMFAIYAGFDKEKTDKLIDIYGDCDRNNVYIFMCAAGLLWSLWCEIKDDYHQYADQQFEYARTFYDYCK